MRTAEIKVGEEYAYKPHSWASAQRVTVLATGVPRQEGEWSYNRRRVNNGVRVRWVNGREAVVASREISESWEDHVAAKQLREESLARAEQDKRETFRARVEIAARVDRVLAGLKGRRGDEAVFLHDLGDLVALREHFEVVRVEGSHVTVLTATRNLDQVLRTGRYDVQDVLLLAGAVEP